MKFKYVIRRMSRNFLYSFLIIAQLVFGFYSLYESINLTKTINKETKKAERFFKGKKAYTLEFQGFNDDNKDFSSLEKAFNKMENSPRYTFIKNRVQEEYIKIFNGYDEFKSVNPYKSKFDGETYFPAKSICINEAYLKVYPLKLEKGRIFNDKEFNFIGKENSVVPIIVGANYGKYFKVGDEILIHGLKIGYRGKIIGILKEDEYGPGDVRSVDTRYINLNNYIVCTDSIFEDEYSLYSSSIFNGNYILFNDSMDKSKINKELKNIKEIFNKVPNVEKVGMRDLTPYINQNGDMLKEQHEIISITAISVIIFVCVTFIISILDSINKRKKEYGIHIMSGGKLSDIAWMTYIEIFMNFFIAYMITVSIIFCKHKEIVNGNTLLMLLIIMTVVSSVSALIPIVRIFKLDVNQLIKGEE